MGWSFIYLALGMSPLAAVVVFAFYDLRRGFRELREIEKWYGR